MYITKHNREQIGVDFSVQYLMALYLVGSTEERFASVHLHQDAAKGPHVNCQVIGHSQQHLWGTVEATLDILVYLKQENMDSQTLPFPLSSK